MSRLLQKAIFWLYIKFHSILINISISLYNTENEILKADPNGLQERDKRVTRKLHRNPLLEKFYAGQKDEKYVKEYYDLLRKADKFKKHSTPNQFGISADKYAKTYGEKDKYGRRYEHFGFFDDKHRHSGKTIGEVLVLEMNERRVNDDDYELIQIYNNTPIEVGFLKVVDVIEKTSKKNVDFEFEVNDLSQKSKQFEFPIRVVRKNEDVDNKIEHLTEFLHVKRIGFEHVLLEFLIPIKFKTASIEDGSDVFNEIIGIDEIYVKDDYGKLIGYNVQNYLKRVMHNDTHEVFKFNAIEMENLNN